MNFSRRTGLLLVLAFTLSLPAVTPRIYAADEVQYFSFLRSIWFDHDLSFDNEYRHFSEAAGPRLPGFRDTFLNDTTATGHRKTFATIGCALLWAPFYAVADAGVRLARTAGASVEADGYSRPYVAAVAYGSAVYGLLALLLSAYACALVFGRERQVPGRDAGRGGSGTRPSSARSRGARRPEDASRWIAVAAVWLGTPLLFYMYVAPPFAHAASAFAVAAFIVAWLRVRRTWSPGGMAALGALAALMTMVREQDVFFVGGVAVDFAWSLIERARERRGARPIAAQLAAAAFGGAVALAAYLPQAIAYVVVNGGLRPSPLVTRKMTWTSPHAWQVVASPEHGLLFWTPLAGLAIAGLILMAMDGVTVVRKFGGPAGASGGIGAGAGGHKPARDGTGPNAGGPATATGGATTGRRIAICLLVMVALQVYVNGVIESWMVAGAFGQRRFVGLTAILVVGLAALLNGLDRVASRRVAVAAMVLAAWWNVALIVQFGTGLMDRQHLTLGTNLYNAFVVVPREIPRIVYRYAFDRNSFYAAPR